MADQIEKTISPTDDEKKVDDSETKVTTNVQNAAIIEKLREIDERQRETDRKIREAEEAATKSKELPLDEKNKLFWANPAQELEKLIKKTVEPLIEFRDEFKANSDYDRVKAEFKNNPKFKDFLALPGIEAQVDSLMAKNPPTRDAFLGSVLGLRGGIELGVIPKPDGYDAKVTGDIKKVEGDNKDKGKDNVNTTIPPHLRPSSAPAPRGATDEKPLRDLTENEERQRIENKLTKREYIELTDEVAPHEVVSWKTEAERSKQKEDK